MKLTLNRLSDNGSQTIGEISVINNNGKTVKRLKTLELPDKNNKPRVSCIPVGVYDCCLLECSPKIKYPHISILKVPDRSGIKIHRGNYVRQIRGCILVGLKHTDIDKDGLIDVTSSTDALNEILELVPCNFKIEIKNSF